MERVSNQNLLSGGVVAISVTLIVYLGALIIGLQTRLIQSITGSIAHVVIRQPERQPLGAWQAPAAGDEALYVGEAVRLEERRRKIEDWPAWTERLPRLDARIAGVAAQVEGQGFLTRGAKRKAVRVTGMVPERYNAIVDVQGSLVSGRFFRLNAGDAVLGRKLAADFAVVVGDKVRLVSDEGHAAPYTVAGVFDTGFTAMDEGMVLIPLKDSQALYALGTAVTAIAITLTGVFEADAVADGRARR